MYLSCSFSLKGPEQHPSNREIRRDVTTNASKDVQQRGVDVSHLRYSSCTARMRVMHAIPQRGMEWCKCFVIKILTCQEWPDPGHQNSAECNHA